MVATADIALAPSFTREKVQQQKAAPRKTNPLLVIGALAIIGLVAVGAFRNAQQVALEKKWTKVVAVGRDVPAGVRIGIGTIRYIDVPRQYATLDMVTSPTDVVGSVTKAFIASGEPITRSLLFPRHQGLSSSLGIDERAITLQLPEDALVDHAIVPGDRVDVIAISSKDGKKYTKTICQDVRVLLSVPREQLVGRHGSSSENNRITLAVTTALTEVLNEAVDSSKIRLALRNPLTRGQSDFPGSGPQDLLPANAAIKPEQAGMQVGNIQPPPPPKFANAPELPIMNSAIEGSKGALEWVVEVISGSKKDQVSVPQN